MRGGGLRGLTVALVAALAACLHSPPDMVAPSCDSDSATDIAAISLGRDHSCALLENGGVWCWGLNDQGQLGDGSAIDRSAPNQVAGLSEVVELAVGQDHTCALKRDETLWCWGSGSNGQLGVGSTEDAYEPVQANITHVADVALGDDFTCAATTDGAVYCWGENEHGQAGADFGDGLQEESPTPIEVDGAALSVVAGKNHACALLEGDHVACWGGADVGQLGDGRLAERSTAMAVELDDVVQMAAGRDHTCAVTGDGRLWCWGSNERGQLGFAGDNDADDCTSSEGLPISCLPVEVELGSSVLAVAAGLYHTCAVMAGGEVGCFGGNDAGQLGYGSYEDSAMLQKVSIDKKIVSLAAGEKQTCAMSDDKSVYCWGSNRAAQLGETAALVASTPVKVPGTTGASAIAAGDDFTCILVGGEVKCWGANDSGQLGNGELLAQSSPTLVAVVTGAVQMAPGEEHTCTINEQANPRCWGRNSHGELGPNGTGDYQLDAVTVPVGPMVVQMDSGDEHSCAVGDDMVAYCWGSDDEGQLGDGDGGGDGVVTVGLTDVVEVATGDRHTCARLSAGQINCWGDNDVGQLGDNSTTPRAAPATSSLDISAARVDVGNDFSCALDQTGHIECWGGNTYGQVGAALSDDRTLEPSLVSLPGAATALSVGAEHACAIVIDNGDNIAVCWGRNDGGQLGDGTTESASIPVRVELPGEPLEIAAGARHTCARVLDGGDEEVYCWGSDIDGTLGSGRELYRSTAYGPVTICP